MTEEEMVTLIQLSPREEGEIHLLEEILANYESQIISIARKPQTKNCHLDWEDVAQLLRLRLWHIIERWPRRGLFAPYAITGLHNFYKNILEGAHRGNGKLPHFTFSLTNFAESLSVEFETSKLQEMLCQDYFCTLVRELQSSHPKMAQGLLLLREGKSLEWVAELYHFTPADFWKELTNQCHKIIRKLDLEDP